MPVKAVIPVAGVGSKLRPHTHTQPKPLIPVAGKPILGHIIDSLIDAGIKDFVFIIGYLGEKIQTYITDSFGERIRAEFVVQSPREGLGHAIWMARENIADAEEVMIVLGDTIIDVDLMKFIEADHSVVGVQEVDDPRNFGVAVLEEDGEYVIRLAEKPKIPKSNLALVGIYKIREVKLLGEALEELMQQEKPAAEEYHLTEALMNMINKGVKIKTIQVDNWFDCGKKETLIETNRILLERMPELKNYEFDNTVIIHPVHISEGCRITGSIIGPYVAVDENAIIENSIVRDSILGAYSHLDSIILDSSVIGSDASLKGKAHSVNIGENTQIDFND